MATFRRLTLAATGHEVFVNFDRVISFIDDDTGKGTLVRETGIEDVWRVRETPAQIMQMLSDTGAVRC